MKILLLSDTHLSLHEIHKRWKIPTVDLLIHAGDLLAYGSLAELKREAVWFNCFLAKKIIYVPGNHDRIFEEEPRRAIEVLRETVPHLQVLINQSTLVDNIRVYGSPEQPEFCGWAFNRRRGEELRMVWSRIPEGPNRPDILVTHAPPFGYGDNTPRLERVGDEDLLS